MRRIRRNAGRVGAALAAGALVATMSGVIGGTAWGTTTAVACPPGTGLTNAIASANPGDTLSISGTCTGNFEINKNLTLVGGTLDGTGFSGPVLTIDSGAVVTL